MVKFNLKGWKKSAVTKDGIFYVDKDDSVVMVKPSGELISDNYMAENELFKVLRDGSYTWLSSDMKYNVKEMKKN